MFGGADIFKKLANECLDTDKSCHEYFSGIGKMLVMNCYGFQIFIHELYKVCNTILLFLCSGISGLTDRQKQHKHKYFYFNHIDKFCDITKKLGINR